jgi:hypothetical protein
VAVVNEVVVDNVSYEGSTLNSVLSSASGIGAPDDIRLEVYLDGSDVREPYMIRSDVEAMGQGPWSWPIERCWPFSAEVRFELWVTPELSTEGNQPYTDTDAMAGDDTITASSPSEDETIELGHEDLTLQYSIRDAPSATHQEVNDPDTGETRMELVRTRAIESAIQDFDTDHDHPVLDGQNIKKAARELSSRLDITSLAGNSADGFPDNAIDLSDQDDRDYCAATALLFAFSQEEPRRLVEFCRSIYDPITVEADGSKRYGYLARSVPASYNEEFVEQFYGNQQTRGGGRTTYQATVDVIILLMRMLLLLLPPIPRTNKDQYRSVFSGLTSFEMRELLTEVVGSDDGAVFRNHSMYQSISQVLQAAIDASSAEKVCMLNIDSLLVQGWKPRTQDDLDSCPPIEGGNHTITVLSMTDNGDDTYTIEWQDPWGGDYGETMTVEETVLNELVTGVVVTGVQGGV